MENTNEQIKEINESNQKMDAINAKIFAFILSRMCKKGIITENEVEEMFKKLSGN